VLASSTAPIASNDRLRQVRYDRPARWRSHLACCRWSRWRVLLGGAGGLFRRIRRKHHRSPWGGYPQAYPADEPMAIDRGRRRWAV